MPEDRNLSCVEYIEHTFQGIIPNVSKLPKTWIDGSNLDWLSGTIHLTSFKTIVLLQVIPYLIPGVSNLGKTMKEDWGGDSMRGPNIFLKSDHEQWLLPYKPIHYFTLALWWNVVWIAMREGLNPRGQRDSWLQLLWLAERELRRLLPSNSQSLSLAMQVVALVWQEFCPEGRNNKGNCSKVILHLFLGSWGLTGVNIYIWYRYCS